MFIMNEQERLSHKEFENTKLKYAIDEYCPNLKEIQGDGTIRLGNKELYKLFKSK